MVNSGHALNGAEPTPIHIHSQTERFDLLSIASWDGIILKELATTGNTNMILLASILTILADVG